MRPPSLSTILSAALLCNVALMPTALGDADPDYVVETGTIMGDFVQLESVSTMVAGMKTISGPMPTVLSVPIALSTAAAGYFGSLSSAGAATSGAVTNTYPGGEGALDSSDAGGAERMLGFGKHDKDFGSTASDGSGSKTAEPSNESKATSGSNTMTSTAASDATTSAPAATSSSSEGGGFMSNLKNIAGGGAGAAADQATSIKTGNHSTSTTSMGSKSTPPSNWDKNGTSCAKRNVTDKAPQGDDGGNGILFTKGASHGTSFGTNKASGSYPTEGAPYPIVNVRPSPSSKAHSEYPRWLPHSTLDITTAPTLSSQSWTTRVVKRDCPVGEISDGQVQVTPCDESSSAQQTGPTSVASNGAGGTKSEPSAPGGSPATPSNAMPAESSSAPPNAPAGSSGATPSGSSPPKAASSGSRAPISTEGSSTIYSTPPVASNGAAGSNPGSSAPSGSPAATSSIVPPKSVSAPPKGVSAPPVESSGPTAGGSASSEVAPSGSPVPVSTKGSLTIYSTPSAPVSQSPGSVSGGEPKGSGSSVPSGSTTAPIGASHGESTFVTSPSTSASPKVPQAESSLKAASSSASLGAKPPSGAGSVSTSSGAPKGGPPTGGAPGAGRISSSTSSFTEGSAVLPSSSGIIFTLPSAGSGPPQVATAFEPSPDVYVIFTSGSIPDFTFSAGGIPTNIGSATLSVGSKGIVVDGGATFIPSGDIPLPAGFSPRTSSTSLPRFERSSTSSSHKSSSSSSSAAPFIWIPFGVAAGFRYKTNLQTVPSSVIRFLETAPTDISLPTPQATWLENVVPPTAVPPELDFPLTPVAGGGSHGKNSPCHIPIFYFFNVKCWPKSSSGHGGMNLPLHPADPNNPFPGPLPSPAPSPGPNPSPGPKKTPEPTSGPTRSFSSTSYSNSTTPAQSTEKPSSTSSTSSETMQTCAIQINISPDDDQGTDNDTALPSITMPLSSIGSMSSTTSLHSSTSLSTTSKNGLAGAIASAAASAVAAKSKSKSKSKSSSLPTEGAAPTVPLPTSAWPSKTTSSTGPLTFWTSSCSFTMPTTTGISGCTVTTNKGGTTYCTCGVSCVSADCAGDSTRMDTMTVCDGLKLCYNQATPTPLGIPGVAASSVGSPSLPVVPVHTTNDCTYTIPSNPTAGACSLTRFQPACRGGCPPMSRCACDKGSLPPVTTCKIAVCPNQDVNKLTIH